MAWQMENDMTQNTQHTPQHWTAEQTAHPDAKNDRWAIVYDPTPGGRDNGDGKKSFSMRFPALLISDCVSDPEASALVIASELNAYPELLEALENLLIAIGMGWDLDGVVDVSRAAIAKAKGE